MFGLRRLKSIFGGMTPCWTASDALIIAIANKCRANDKPDDSAIQQSASQAEIGLHGQVIHSRAQSLIDPTVRRSGILVLNIPSMGPIKNR